MRDGYHKRFAKIDTLRLMKMQAGERGGVPKCAAVQHAGFSPRASTHSLGPANFPLVDCIQEEQEVVGVNPFT